MTEHIPTEMSVLNKHGPSLSCNEVLNDSKRESLQKTFREETPTWNDSASQPWDALHAWHVVVDKIVIAGGVDLGPVTEQQPQFGGDRHVIDDLRLEAAVEVVVLQSAIP